MIAISLSMDAFSIAIIYGTLNLKRSKILVISALTGLFHFFMPIIGFFLGKQIFNVLPISPSFLAGIIFLILAIQMLLSLEKKEEIIEFVGIVSLFLFAFSVSIDSFSVGISLGAITSNLFLAATTFSITSFLFTYLGFKLGNKLKEIYGRYATLVSSIVLLALSILYLTK
jgi:putative Mn2+ efflux pump MntP